MEDTFTKKLDSLKNTYRDDESRGVLKSWEQEMIILKATKEWQDHPITKTLTDICIERVKLLKTRLANDRTLTDADRQQFFSEIDAHFVYLAILTEDPVAKMQVIEKQVNSKL